MVDILFQCSNIIAQKTGNPILTWVKKEKADGHPQFVTSSYVFCPVMNRRNLWISVSVELCLSLDPLSLCSCSLQADRLPHPLLSWYLQPQFSSPIFTVGVPIVTIGWMYAIRFPAAANTVANQYNKSEITGRPDGAALRLSKKWLVNW